MIYTAAIVMSISVATSPGLSHIPRVESPTEIFPQKKPSVQVSLITDFILYCLTYIAYFLRKSHKKLSLVMIYRHLRYNYPKNSNCVYKIFRKYVIWSASLNLILLTFSNMSILNPGPVNNLSVLYQNVQGLLPISELAEINPTLNLTKLHEFQAYVYSQSPDIIIINETWLKPCIHDNEIFPPEAYKIFRCDRSPDTHPPDPSNPNRYRRNGGGVLIAIKSSLDITSKRVNIKCKAEALSIELTLSNNTKICISTVYRVGTLGTENLLQLKEYYNEILRNRKLSKLYIIGDINLPDISNSEWNSGLCNSPLSQAFLDLFDNLGLSQRITEPTHYLGNILDVLLTNSPQTVSEINVAGKDSVCASDHLPITCKIRANVRRKQANKRTIYNFKKADWSSLNQELAETPWYSLLSHEDVNVCWDNFKTSLESSCDKHIPRIIARDGFKPPWFDSEVFELCREKERIRIKIKALKAKIDLQDPSLAPVSCPKIVECELKFQNVRRQVKKLIRSKMYSNFSDDKSENAISKKFWSYVKSSSNSHRIPESVSYKDVHRNCSEGQAELFNKFFYEQFSSPSNYDIQINYSRSSNFDINIDVAAVEKLLNDIDPNKAPGPDKIHGKILKKCAKNLAVPLAMLFRTSYYTCIIPKDWKSANVVPVYKKGSKSSVENYRPISLTSLVMKLYERIIASELLHRVNDKLDNRQHGFVPMKSCETQLIPFSDYLAKCLNRGSRTDIIYFDFAKAFDSVNHDIILAKLKEQYNIDGLLLKFFVEYLSGRAQRVVIGNTQSSDLPVASGVPQGSILGPILFVMFINDIGSNLSPESKILLYADDTKLYKEINNEQDCLALQADIDNLVAWSSANKMRFHPSKCKVLTVTLQRNNPVNFTYNMSGEPLQVVESEKDLGVHITSNLSWTKHCTYLYSKACRNFGLMRRTCNFIKNVRQRRSLYLAMIRSQFEHCSSLWSPNTITMIDRLESLQKRCIKWILREEFHSYSPEIYYNRCKTLDLLPIKFRLILKDLKLFHSIVNNRSPISLPENMYFHNGSSRLRSSHLDELSIVSNIHPRITANYNSREIVSASSLSQFSNSYFYRTMNNWNMLSHENRSISFPNTFEQAVINHLWEMARPVE